MLSLKNIALSHLAVLVVLTVPVAIFSSMQQMLNCLLGGAMIGLNLFVIVWSTKRITQKKSVALAGSVIVIKYAAFIGILMALYAFGWRVNFGFALGISTALPTIALAAFRHLRLDEANGSF